jgi:hypothetical protein
MKLTQLFESKITQFFTMKVRGKQKFTYSFMLRLLGCDGPGRKVYVGNCQVHEDSPDNPTDNNIFAAVVMRSVDVSVLAIHYGTTMEDVVEAADLAIYTARWGYGPHTTKSKSWETHPAGNTKLDGYDNEAD